MTRKQALIELRDKVEAGGLEGTRMFIKAFSLNPDNRHLSAWSAYNGSLDAALALHQAVLPGWEVETFNLSGEVVLRRSKPVDTVYGEALRAGNPARAWLLAILSALISECEE